MKSARYGWMVMNIIVSHCVHVSGKQSTQDEKNNCLILWASCWMSAITEWRPAKAFLPKYVLIGFFLEIQLVSIFTKFLSPTRQFLKRRNTSQPLPPSFLVISPLGQPRVKKDNGGRLGARLETCSLSSEVPPRSSNVVTGPPRSKSNLNPGQKEAVSR